MMCPIYYYKPNHLHCNNQIKCKLMTFIFTFRGNIFTKQHCPDCYSNKKPLTHLINFAWNISTFSFHINKYIHWAIWNPTLMPMYNGIYAPFYWVAWNEAKISWYHKYFDNGCSLQRAIKPNDLSGTVKDILIKHDNSLCLVIWASAL